MYVLIPEVVVNRRTFMDILPEIRNRYLAFKVIAKFV